MILAIGNGESRRGLDLNQIALTKVGCNAAHRELDLEHLICVDRGTLREAAEALRDKKTKIYTRPEYTRNYQQLNVLAVPELPYQGDQRPDKVQHWGSGPYAVLLAAQLSDEIHMVGFDLWGNGELVNNVYKGTDHYSKPDSRAVDPRYWIYQNYRVFLSYPDKYFIVYNVEGWQQPETWNLANVRIETLDKLSSIA